jgi:hypothetical protein
MSEKHLYEKHLAEKLQQLSPPPDVDGNWQKMKALLDDDSPRGGAFKRWWRLGAITGLLLIGGWIATTQLSSPGEKLDQVATGKPNSANVDEKRSLPGNTLPAGDEKNAANANGPTPSGGSNAGTPVKDGPLAIEKARDKPASSSGGISEIDGTLPDADKKLLAGVKKPGKEKQVNISPDIGSKQRLTRNSPGKKNDKKNTVNNRTKDGITLHNSRKENTGLLVDKVDKGNKDMGGAR